MPKYPFLSTEWMDEAKKIRDEVGAGPAVPHKIKVNLLLTEVPAEVSDGDVQVHMDTTEGEMKMDLGPVDGPDLSLSIDYATAKAIFVDQNPQAGMQAFMTGKIKVLSGDMTKMMALQSAGGAADPVAIETAKRIQEITA